MSERFAVVVPWVSPQQRDAFLEAWNVPTMPDWLILQHDPNREGSGATKNKGIARALVERHASIVVVLDDDCFPHETQTLGQLVEAHVKALQPQPVKLFSAVTRPVSRGTPYMTRTVEMPVAASMGFWTEIGDYCAVRQLAHNGRPMTFDDRPVFGRYFPLCGMNIAFRPLEWEPWFRFIEVPRFDDIWMGWLWQREAYRRLHCFNLAGPMVRHARQSNVWKNLQQEAVWLERNETLWRDIAMHPSGEYDQLRALLPV
ncbi:MAG: hypothetical protein HOP28_16045 [Gemmatimonadales bacterium]|nr:hypothetical protein [Gemmatimonadales bacterium]